MEGQCRSQSSIVPGYYRVLTLLTSSIHSTKPPGVWSVLQIIPAWPCIMLVYRQCSQANAIGRSSKTVREFLEKNYKDDASESDTIKLAVKSLLEVVQTGAKNIDLAVMDGHGSVRVSMRRSWNALP